jgi:hypothetical protein
MSERPPARPKSWRRQSVGLPAADAAKEPETADNPPTHAAPGHQGGSFSDARYESLTTRGQLGFRVWS